MDERELRQLQNAARLITGFLAHTLTEQEHHDLDEWIAESDDHMKLFEQLTDETNTKWAKEWFRNLDRQQARADTRRMPPVKKIPRIAIAVSIAASVLLVIAVFSMRGYFSRHDIEKPPATLAAGERLTPEHRHTRLFDNSGHTIELSDTAEATIAVSPGANATKRGNVLDYSGITDGPGVNVIQTPVGGFYRLILSDGSKLWLNAASRLQYPVSFDRKNRKVSLSGEAFFEIVRDHTRPFIVETGGVLITVLGTAFNISQYPGKETHRVSVMQGSVSLVRDRQATVLTAGQIALLGTDITVVNAEHPDDATAWTRGMFSFHKSPIEEVLGEVSRWYGIDVIYQGKIDQRFTGSILRNSTLAQVLDMISITGRVHLSIKDHKILARP